MSVQLALGVVLLVALSNLEPVASAKFLSSWSRLYQPFDEGESDGHASASLVENDVTAADTREVKAMDDEELARSYLSKLEKFFKPEVIDIMRRAKAHVRQAQREEEEEAKEFDGSSLDGLMGLTLDDLSHRGGKFFNFLKKGINTRLTRDKLMENGDESIPSTLSAISRDLKTIANEVHTLKNLDPILKFLNFFISEL